MNMLDLERPGYLHVPLYGERLQRSFSNSGAIRESDCAKEERST
jgi:hypothetical protein